MQPIEVDAYPMHSAPKDGTVVLTDCGTACYVSQKRWGSPVREGWWLCQTDCQPDFVDSGPIYPTRWAPIPTLKMFYSPR